jgi:hypothetical protein
MWRIAVFFCFTATFALGQPGFNFGYQSGYTNNDFYDLVIKNDTIVALGTAQDSSLGYRKGLLLVKFDTIGNLITQNLIIDSTNLLSIYKYWVR